jgi:hypothetical protein
MEPRRSVGEKSDALFKGQVSKFPTRNTAGEKPGGWDPKARLGEMEVDGVSAEVLYPTQGLASFRPGGRRIAGSLLSDRQRLDDRLLQGCAGPSVGIPMISLYNIPNAIKELERCKKAGMVGCLIWQVPPDHLPFTSDYYDPFWEGFRGFGYAGQPAHSHRF